MGLFDWLGPLNAGGKRRGWDALPAPVSERKAADPWTITDMRAALTVNTLVHGPGSRELLGGHRNADGNSAVYACLQIIATALAEPPLRVYRERQGKRVEQDGTPLGELLARPNPHLTMAQLLGYLSNCLHVDGNAYWRKLRAGNDLTGNVVELWPISPSRIQPRTTEPGDFISFYRYYVRPGVYEDIPPENIVHFRMGIDDADHRLGCAPLKRLLREVSSDEAATFYADRLLGKLAIPGLYAAFDKDAPSLDQPQADELKARLAALYGGENVGSVGIGSPGMTLSQLGFSPEQMDMKTLHRVPEERIAAVLGVPAIVAGLGAGLDRSTYSNFAEAREAFTEMKLIPSWRAIGEALTLALVPDFASERGVSVAFMIDEVRALQDDQNAKAVRLQTYVSAGILDANEAREEIGRAPRSPERPADAAPGGVPPATRSRAPLTVLRRKSLEDLPGRYEALKDAAEGDWESALLGFLEEQLRRVTRALRAGADDADTLVAEGEATLLGEVLTPRQLALFEEVRGLVVAELGIDFEIDDALTREYLRAAGANIQGITQTTREAVRAALIEGQAAGEGIPQLAARLRELSAFGPSRAVTVARTELGMATQAAALSNYRASGVVVGITVWDGDYDAECAAMNGRKFPLNAPPALLQHPRCRRSFAPIVDAAELDRSA